MNPEDILQALRGDQGPQGERGLDGKTPQKGVDYFTPEEINAISQYLINQVHQARDGKDGLNGKDADEEAIIQRVIPEILNRIPRPRDGKDGSNGKDGKSPSIIEVAKAVIKLMQDEKSIDISHIRNGEQIAGSLRKLNMADMRWHGGAPTLVAGSNVNITTNADGSKTISSTGGSGGTQVKQLFNVSSATTMLTLSNTPLAGTIVSASYEGQLIYETQAWTRSGTTITLLFTPEDNTKIEVIYEY